MMHNKGLQEDDIQNLHTITPEELTDKDSGTTPQYNFYCADLVRKHSGGWDKEYPKCLSYDKTYRFRTFTVQCHMTSQVTVSGNHKCETVVCNMKSTKDDSPLKPRFFSVRKEIYNLYKEKQQTEQ
jgi:hypothetical protein